MKPQYSTSMKTFLKKTLVLLAFSSLVLFIGGCADNDGDELFVQEYTEVTEGDGNADGDPK